jgi:hypothetical protein
MFEWVVALLDIQEILDTNIYLKAGFPDQGFFVVFLTPSRQYQYSVSN